MSLNPTKTWQFWLGVGITLIALVVIYMIWNNMPSSDDLRHMVKVQRPEQKEKEEWVPEVPQHTPETFVQPHFVLLTSSDDGQPNSRRVERSVVEESLPSLPQDFITKVYAASERDSKGEKECRRVLESIFGVQFYKIRSKYLLNDLRGGHMELDGFSPEVTTFQHNGMIVKYNGLAFEYNGEQHTLKNHGFNKDDQAFLEQVYRDQRKIQLCDQYGIYLITIDHTVKPIDIEAYIRYYLPDAVMARG